MTGGQEGRRKTVVTIYVTDRLRALDPRDALMPLLRSPQPTESPVISALS